MVACFTSDAALGGPFLAKSRYHVARGHRKTACSPVWDLFVRLQKPLLNDDYAARRSICAFSAVEGVWAVRADRVVLRWLDECDSQRRPFDPTEPLLLRGGGLQTTRPNFRVAVLLKYRSNAHDVVEGTYADDPGPIGSLRKLLGARRETHTVVKVRSPHTGPEVSYPRRRYPRRSTTRSARTAHIPSTAEKAQIDRRAA